MSRVCASFGNFFAGLQESPCAVLGRVLRLLCAQRGADPGTKRSLALWGALLREIFHVLAAKLPAPAIAPNERLLE